ncbi:ImpA family type VI secretion system protein [Achromobacter sp. NFACC18-2]|uniref:type VI secretion system protein TssA n=1 Tax=Achromobacter sp. NFACC18-2 TaxID=1564112 RepID=UPI0008B83F37|nr:type VI secretion system ImpA family N-terminal domain-containing protein [Achromobacter sp. NFACC18-2]SEJ77364.1 type VI secretion system protein ImpA [Achromobacter sp. NFACC18-2]
MDTATPADLGPDSDLLQPLEGPLPCGPDLEYDPDFVVLHANVAPRGDAQYGDFVDAAPAINWADAERDCRALLARSKDLRLLIVLARCRVRQAGAAGLRAALALIDAMLRRYPGALNPVPLLDGEPDPLIVSNVLAALADPDGLAADVRDIGLPKSMGTPLRVRDIERALARTRAKDALSPEAATRLVSDLHDRRDPVVTALSRAFAALGRIQDWAAQHLDGARPDLGVLVQLLQPFHAPTAAPPVQTGLAAAPAPSEPSAPGAAPPGAALPLDPAAPAPALPGAAVTRWDMLETLRSARQWFEFHEPSSPVSVLLKQAERMVGRRYAELHRMVPAELLEQWDAPQD